MAPSCELSRIASHPPTGNLDPASEGGTIPLGARRMRRDLGCGHQVHGRRRKRDVPLDEHVLDLADLRIKAEQPLEQMASDDAGRREGE
jgi:hypothetical protein